MSSRSPNDQVLTAYARCVHQITHAHTLEEIIDGRSRASTILCLRIHRCTSITTSGLLVYIREIMTYSLTCTYHCSCRLTTYRAHSFTLTRALRARRARPPAARAACVSTWLGERIHHDQNYSSFSLRAPHLLLKHRPSNCK